MTKDRRGLGRRQVLRAGSVGFASFCGCLLSREPYTETEERSFEPGEATALAVRTADDNVTLTGEEAAQVTGTVRMESRPAAMRLRM